MSCFQWFLKTLARGSFCSLPCSEAFEKAVDSTRRRRTQRPTMTMTTENRNGMRQPQSRNACDGIDGSSEGRIAAMTRNRPFAMMKPMGAPSCGKVPNRARLPSGAFSVATSAAPDHSPPSAKPCAMRRMTSSRGASHPTIA